MRLLAIVHKYPPVHNAGAEWMLHSIFRNFIVRGDLCTVVYAGAVQSEIDGVFVLPLPTDDELVDLAKASDVIVTHLDETPRAMRVAAYAGKPIVHLVHNDSQLRFNHVRPDPGVLVAFNSQWLAHGIGWPGDRWCVTRPHVNVADYDVKGRAGTALTLINITKAKGASTFYGLTNALPDEHFIAVRGCYGKEDLRPRENLEIVEHTPNIRDVYERTRILLMPSGYESWGRTGIEAACSGIPTIATPTPGLVESLGYAGIYCNADDIADWAQVINCLAKPDEYEHHARLSRRRARELEVETLSDLDNLHSQLGEMIEVALRPRRRYPAPTAVQRPHRPARSADVAVLVPWRASERRAELLEYVEARYHRLHPELAVVRGTVEATDPWSKGEAVAQARAQVDAEVLVIADADSVVTHGALAASVLEVMEGRARWAMPYTFVRRLNEASTEVLLDTGNEPYEQAEALCRASYRGIPGGGITVVAADAYDESPMDPRFEGWGGEDEAFGLALACLHGPAHQENGALWHLWHPPATLDHTAPSASVGLLGEYRSARRLRRHMRLLLAGQPVVPAEPLERPVRFRSMDARRVLRVGNAMVRFAAGEVELDDPDLVDVLRSTPGVVEVLA